MDAVLATIGHWRASPISIKHRGQYKLANIYNNLVNILKPCNSVIGHGIGGKHIPAKMARLTESQSLE
jgi:hypothetical protein